MGKTIPSMDAWLAEAKRSEHGPEIGMYLTHNGVVRETSRSKVREGKENADPVKGMLFSYDSEKVEQAVADTRRMAGIGYVRVWLNEGYLQVGDDIMYVLLGGDIRPHVTEALSYLVGRIKNECVSEQELTEI